MATETTTRLVDDIDGSDADTTVSYTWNGQQYEIDLSKKNADEFADALAPYISASRRVGKGSSKPAAKAKGGEVDMRKVREWAEANGVEVSPRGRIKQSVVDQYLAAQ